jgi:sucrose-6F-phosphate phosphohydrolase
MDHRQILVTDLDGTLLGDVVALARFREWWSACRGSRRLVYATGRHLASVRALVEGGALPEPHAVISAVGTEIHDAAGNEVSGWASRFHGWHAGRVREILRPVRWLEAQPQEHQSSRKASFFVHDPAPDDIAFLEGLLAAAGCRATLVRSGGRFLDVVPERAGKGQATHFLAERWSVPTWRVLAFGDSGNDLELLSSGFLGTIVANALPELRDAVPDRVYRSPLAFADGVLDGVRFWSDARIGPVGDDCRSGSRSRRSVAAEARPVRHRGPT